MRIMLTGHAGFIGSRLLKKLLELGHEIIGIDNFSTGKKENIFRHKNLFSYEHDLKNWSMTKVIISDTKPEVIFHLAGSASVPESFKKSREFFENNVMATNNLLCSIDPKITKKIIFASSSSVYGNMAGENVLESYADTAKQYSPYAFTKMNCERLFEMFYKLYEINYTVLRYFNVYEGSGKGRGVIDKWINQKNNNEEILQFGNTERDYTHVDDIVKANIAAIDYYQNPINPKKTFNVGTGKKTSLNDIANNLGIKPIMSATRAEDIQVCTANINLAKIYLNYKPSIFGE